MTTAGVVRRHGSRSPDQGAGPADGRSIGFGLAGLWRLQRAVGEHPAAVVYALRAMTDPSITANDGLLRPPGSSAPAGASSTPTPGGRLRSPQHVPATRGRPRPGVLRLVAEQRGRASTVTFAAMNLSSSAPGSGRRSVLSDVLGGGTGAHADGPGLDGVDTYMANVGLMPVEVAETNYSVRVLRTELIEGSQGRGAFDGGRGIRREYLILDGPEVATYYAEQTNERFRPSGVAGGGDAAPSRVTVLGSDGRPRDLPRRRPSRWRPERSSDSRRAVAAASAGRPSRAKPGADRNGRARRPALARRRSLHGRRRSRRRKPSPFARARSSGSAPTPRSPSSPVRRTKRSRSKAGCSYPASKTRTSTHRPAGLERPAAIRAVCTRWRPTSISSAGTPSSAPTNRGPSAAGGRWTSSLVESRPERCSMP